MEENLLSELMQLKFVADYWVIVLPCILMALDIITGYYNAWEKHKVSSSKMRDGLGKKLGELVYIVVGILIAFAFGIKMIEYFISIYVIYMEIISLLENCKKLGVPMLPTLLDKLNKEEK